MFKSRIVVKGALILCCAVAVSGEVVAQNNLTAKVTSMQPQPVAPLIETDRVRDGLAGPVRRVRTEVAKLSSIAGRVTEEKRVVLEIAAYDMKGVKTENQYFPVAGSALTGKEVYKYDDKGNISEMTMLNNDGSLLSKEMYKYEYDNVGNWIKMMTSVAVMEGGKVNFEPSEVTYRVITYYLDENMLKMAQPAGQPTTSSPAPKGTTTNNNVNKTLESANHKAVVSLPTTNAANEQIKASDSSTGKNDKAMVMLNSEPPPSLSTSAQPRPLLRPVSGGVLNGKALSLPAPSYPELAKRMKTSGIVTVDVVLDENGKVISAVANSGPPTLRDAAVRAALQARFSATTLSGQPVKVTGVINYKFSLAQ